MLEPDRLKSKASMKFEIGNKSIGHCTSEKACEVEFAEFMKEKYLSLVRKSYRMLKHKRLRDRPWWRAMTRPLFDRQLWIPCRDTVAAGLAIGFFFSMILVLPMQMIFSAVVSMRFRVNVPFAMLACWISNVFTNVPIGLVQVAIGDWMRQTFGIKVPGFESVKISFDQIEFNAASFLLGMIVSGVLLALAAFPIVHLFSMILPHHLPVLKRRPLLKRKVD
jgi:uncharacterized protein